ncbi:hypothetical protein [Paenibacillus sp. y28]|uniref:hypothetical protein n=1 Tax=Paenibacillus sp. y28 TaxID=3129110 RepID=UPI0030183B4D
MPKTEELTLEQSRLVYLWKEGLPNTLSDSDKAEVLADGRDPKALRIHIRTAGHEMYSFDFKVTYIDSREIKVDLIDAERDNRTVDESTDIIQTLVEDYIRHIHECAQQLKSYTQ